MEAELIETVKEAEALAEPPIVDAVKMMPSIMACYETVKDVTEIDIVQTVTLGDDDAKVVKQETIAKQETIKKRQ
jgi:hypothetical protein